VNDAAYQPDRGDFIWLDFNPQAGHEQAGRRPALVLSPKNFNIATGLAVVCPVTNTESKSRFAVPVPRGALVTGVVLSHHFRTVDWIARKATFHSRANEELMWDVLGCIEAILMIES